MLQIIYRVLKVLPSIFIQHVTNMLLTAQVLYCCIDLFLCALLKNQTDQLYILWFKDLCTYWLIKANQYELCKQLKING